ncbi:DUF6600 domain-containing protein, partial [Xanthobacteraceae bacterium A53D]
MTARTDLKLPGRLMVAGLAASFVVGSLALAPAALAQPGPRPAAGQQQVDINIFYQPLAEHGSWVSHPVYQYVWVPAGVDQAWRPYQDGRWVWTEDGWYWDSAEPFAWATYHYGRWGYDPDVGWFWVPGDTWAPAWVQWRRGEGRTGWAPLAPDAPGYAYGAPKRYQVSVAESWVFVEDDYLAAPDLATRVLPVAALAAWLGSNPRSYDPVYGNGRVVTRFVPPNDFGGPVAREVVTRRLVYVDGYRQEFDDDDGARLGIYRPYIGRADRLPPPPRVMRDLPPDRRVLIRQYVGPQATGILAPSAALLGVMTPDQRRNLREARFRGDESAYRRDIDRYRDNRRDQLERAYEQSERNRDAFERARLDAARQQQQQQRQILQQRQQRAQEVMQRLERERPNAVPPALPKAADAPGGRALPVTPVQAPGTAPGMPPGTPPGAAPGVPPGAAPGTPPGTPPGARPGTPPGTPPGAAPGAAPGTPPAPPPGARPGTPPGTPPGAAPSAAPGTPPAPPPGARPGTPPGAAPGTPPPPPAGARPGADPEKPPGKPPGAPPPPPPGAAPAPDGQRPPGAP